MTWLRKILSTQASTAVIFIRLMVGTVFLSEGLQKFLRPDEVGSGRFESIEFPNPEFAPASSPLWRSPAGC